MDPKIVEAVRSFKEIKNARQSKSWLGLCGYYRKFCEGYTDIVAPIQKLTVQGVPFVWSSPAKRKELGKLWLKSCVAIRF